MSCLVQISDPHFGTERALVVEALVDLVHQLAPEHVLLSGDITQRATVAEFAAARAFVDRLAPARVLAIPGNHDVPLFDPVARLCWPYARYQQAFGDDLLHRHAWAEAAERVLKHHLNLPAQRAHQALIEQAQLLVAETDIAL